MPYMLRGEKERLFATRQHRSTIISPSSSVTLRGGRYDIVAEHLILAAEMHRGQYAYNE